MTITPAYPKMTVLNGINVNQLGTIRRQHLRQPWTADDLRQRRHHRGDSFTISPPPADDDAGRRQTHNDGVQIKPDRSAIRRVTTFAARRIARIIITQDAGTVGDLTIDDNDPTAGPCPSTSSPMACCYPISRCGATTSAGISDPLARQSWRVHPRLRPDITGSVGRHRRTRHVSKATHPTPPRRVSSWEAPSPNARKTSERLAFTVAFVVVGPAIPGVPDRD